jgi:hypothetical protein
MGTSTSNKPESCVEVVVARMIFGVVGAAASVGASVAASVAINSSVAGAVVGVEEAPPDGDVPQAANIRESTSKRMGSTLYFVCFILIPFLIIIYD